MKKAFTLVELLAIIVILGVIAIVSIPAINDMLESQKEDEYDKFVKDLYLVAENYVTIESSIKANLNKNDNIFINIGDLINEGYITHEIVNPKTEEVIDSSDTIKVIKNDDNSLSFEYYDFDITTDAYPQNGLVLHLDGYTKPDNNVWTDLSGNGNAVLNNIASDAWDGNSITFDGVNDYAIISGFGSNITESMSVVVTFKGLKNNIWGSGILGSNHTSQGRLYISGGDKFGFNFTTPSIDAWTTTSTVITPNNIYNNVTVFDRTTNNNNIIYVNGESVYSDTRGLDVTWNVGDLTIGKAFGINSYLSNHPYNNSSVYDVLIYDRVLSEEEVKSIYTISSTRIGE